MNLFIILLSIGFTQAQLLNRGPTPSPMIVCNYGMETDNPRCLERLRHDDAEPLDAETEQQENTPDTGNLLSLPNNQLENNGFYGEHAPHDLRKPMKTFTSSEAIPINSQACARVRNNDCSSYQQVDMYLSHNENLQSIFDDLVETYPGDRYDLVVRQAGSLRKINEALNYVTSTCHVIRHLFFFGHGNQARISVDRNDRLLRRIRLSRLLPQRSFACALTAESRVRVSGCNMACRSRRQNSALVIMRALRQHVRNPHFRMGGQHTLNGARFLFSTGTSTVEGMRDDEGRSTNFSIIDSNDNSVLYTLRENSVETDQNLESVPMCGH